jgi:hypothetical protein
MAGTRFGFNNPDRERTRFSPRHRRSDEEAIASPVADDTVARRRIPALQRTVGNAAVCRLLERGRAGATAGAPLQRYPVDVPADADCDTLLDWMNSSNPYVPNWAQTSCEYEPLVERFRITGTAPNFRLRLRNPRVRFLGCEIDLPEWAPSDPAMRDAWEAEMRHIRAHENEHVGIGRRERRIMQNALRDLNLPVTADTREEAMAQAQDLFDAEWARIETEGQARQNAIDPHPGNLQCPDQPIDEETGEETETEESAAGPLSGAFDAIGETLSDAAGGLASWLGAGEEPATEGGDHDGAAVAANTESATDGGSWFGDLFSTDDAGDKEDDGSWWG